MVELNPKQQIGFDKFTEGVNLFITGGGGVGKSTLLEYIIGHCSDNNIRVAITASTGISAIQINGCTIHSLLCINIYKFNVFDIYDKIKNNTKKYKLLKMLDVLIIDEISMIDKYLFNRIDRILQLVRNNDKPFGGLQVILSGDFCQLKPVKSDKFCFESPVWTYLNLETIHLTESIRQDNAEFIRILKHLRFGLCPKSIYDILYSHYLNTRYTRPDGVIRPTWLYSNNVDVDRINDTEHNKLKKNNEYNTYPISYNKSNTFLDKYIRANNISKSIELCVGDQVMVTCNIDADNHIMNGTRGAVVDVSYDSCVKIQLFNGNIECIFYKTIEIIENKCRIILSYLPIRLAYSITIHKSQGMTIDYLSIDLTNIFEYGQAYVGLSRVRSLDSLVITNISRKSFKCHEKVLKFYKMYSKKIKQKAANIIYKWLIKRSECIKLL